jgi:hypothetical protein
MNIRTFQPGDEAVQAEIYNEAARDLPKFKPATTVEVQRRTRARDFDPSMRLFAEEGGRPVGYALFNANGRVSYPWCRPGYDHLAEPLFENVATNMRQRGFREAFAAYREDWTAVGEFFQAHDFRLARQMVNFLLDVLNLPTLPGRPSSNIGPLERKDLPALYALAPQALRVRSAAELEKYLYNNPYLRPESLFVLRARASAQPLAAGVLITEPTYADPRGLDAFMPCFRLGAFGTENMQAKRIKGLFSFLAKPDQSMALLAVELLGTAALRLQDCDDLGTFAAQVPSDIPELLAVYQRHFRRQGHFPVFERNL